MFGFEAGAFTDAKRAKPGLFEAASGGTLSWTRSMPCHYSSRATPQRHRGEAHSACGSGDRALGGCQAHRRTPTDLQSMSARGHFRADLYHRLAVVMLTLPPLRERGEDCLILAQHFLRRYTEAPALSEVAEHGGRGMAPELDWPGNVRELSHLMERVALLSPETIIGSQTFERLCLPRPGTCPQMQAAPSGGDAAPIDEPTRIAQTLLQAEGNVMRAARLLDISRGALRYRMRQYGIERPNRQDPGRHSRSLPLEPSDSRPVPIAEVEAHSEPARL